MEVGNNQCAVGGQWIWTRRTTVPASLPLVAAVFQLALNFAFPSASIVFGAVLVAMIVWLAKAEYLPALVITQLNRTNFLLGGYGSDEFAASQFESTAVLVAGFPITVSYVLGVAVSARVVFEWLVRPSTFRRLRVERLVLLWVIAFIPAVLMAWEGRVAGNPSWTAPVRIVLMSGSLFYGVLLARTWPRDGRLIFRWLVPMSFVFFVLAAAGCFHHRILWIVAAFAAPFTWLCLRQRALRWKSAGVAFFAVASFYCLGLSQGKAVEDVSHAAGLLGSSSSTFTLNALWAVSICVTFVLLTREGRIQRTGAWILGIPAFLAIVVISFVIAVLSPEFRNDYRGQVNVPQNELSLADRLKWKIFDDRSRIWNATLKDIVRSPYFVSPSGEPLLVELPNGNLIYWDIASHNAVFEVLRQLRWFSGPIVLFLLLVLMTRCARCLASSSPQSFKVLCAGTLVTATIGVFTGHYPLSDDAAFWFLCLGGVGMSGVVVRQQRSLT